jgi:Membrane protein involved in colicin uptake
MAKVIQMKNGLEDKKQDLKKKLDKQKVWIRTVDIISIILLLLMFWNRAVFATTSTSQSFEQVKQQNQQKFEAESKKMQEEFQQKSSQMQQEYNDNVKKMQEQHDANVKQQQQSQQDNGKKVEENIKQFHDDQMKQIEDAKKKEEAKKQGQTTPKTQNKTSKSSNTKPIPMALIAVIVIGNMGNRLYRWRKINEIANQMNIYSAGIKGEANALGSLERLSNDYVIITNPMIHANGRSNELDNLIIGSNGVFIVETKNYVGTVYGNVNDQKWTQERSGRKTKEFYNPIMQVNQHGRRVEEFLRKLGYNINPTTMVYFVNPNIELNINGVSNTEVFKYKDLDMMINKIEYFKGNITLSQKDKETIVRAVTNQNR